jgi:Domain of unknown function (DUF4395)
VVDPRGQRFVAALTSVVLAVALVTANGWLLVAQTAVFLAGATLGLRAAPYGWIFRVFVRPRLGPPSSLEYEAPPRFAQAVGAVFATFGSVGFLAGVPALGYVATAFALAAAFLNAAFGYCLGCQFYLVFRTWRGVNV